MIELLIWLFIVNLLAFSIAKTKYGSPIKKKFAILMDIKTNKLRPTYGLLYQLVKCSFCLAFWMGIFILSWTAEPIKTIFGIDFFFNFVLDGIFSLFLNILLLITYGLFLKTLKIIKNK